MRTDLPWLEIRRRLRQPKPQRLVEEEVPPGAFGDLSIGEPLFAALPSVRRLEPAQ
jgi:hypothetical protein